LSRIPAAAFFALFTVSGFAGLIYESIWSHYLKLFLGHAAYAQTLVLAIFMGGMALGAWLVSRFTLRIPDLLKGYAIAELGIGLLAIAFHSVFQATTGWALETLFPAMGGSGAVDAVKWLIASALILPASLLLGSTFPLMSAGVLRAFPETGGAALAMLYFTNSFGAAAGVLASGFVLIPGVGLPGTILTAGIMNVLLAATVWLLAGRVRAVRPAAPQDAEGAGVGARGLALVIMCTACATGAASFVYEITWIRMLSMGLGSSTHAFEIMLAAFILGMSLGALMLRRRLQHMRNDMAWLAGLLFAKALFAVYAVWIYGDVLEFVRWTLAAAARTDQGYALVTVAGLVASMMVMLPTAFCAGMTLPLATHALTRRGHGEAMVGRVYAANTAGCILGAAFTTHVGMELLGVKNLTGLGALVDVSVALAVLAAGLEATRRRAGLATGAVLVVVGVIAFSAAPLDLLRMTSGVFRFGIFEDPARVKLAFYRDGKTATIAVTDNNDNNRRSIKTNGKTDAAITLGRDARPGPDEGTMVMLGAIPIALKPGAASVANIGFGSGLTTHVLLGSPAVREIDTIEIERMVIEGARLFHPRNRRAYEDPRSRIHVDDAKTFLATRGKRYDVIVSEPSNPWVSGVSTLYSREFYAQVRRHLNDDGLLVQWVHSYEISFDLVASIFKAIGATFGDYAVYRVGTVDLLIVATPAKALPPMRADLFGYPGLAAELAYLGFEEVQDLARLRVGGRAALEGVFARSAFPTNSDYFPVLDQHAPAARFRGDNAHELRDGREGLVPILAMLDGEVRTPVARVRRARPDAASPVAKARAATEAVGILLTGRADAAQVLPAEERSAALLAHGLLGGCEGAQGQWLQAIHQVLGLALSVLERADVNIAFERIRASRCYQSLDELSRARVALLEAMNDRDAEAMRRQGEALLARDDPGLDAARPVWLATALTGHLAVGDLAAARQLWNRHATRLTAIGRAAFPMRVLHARLAEGA
jgi:predicted membrane-bound spermidine synthase